MGSDIETNNLIMENDVFADIFNVNISADEMIISPEDLCDVYPVDSYYQKNSKSKTKRRKLTRDAIKKVEKLGACVAFVGFESQNAICNIMPLRVMGYDYASYMKQVDEIKAENKKNKNEAYVKEIHDWQKLKPVFTYVLYFGQENWEKPVTLADMIDIPDELKTVWKNQMSDYKINVINMVNQPEEVRKKYKSDFKFIVDYLAIQGDRDKLKVLKTNGPINLTHVDKILDLLHCITGDDRFDRIMEEYDKLDDDKKGERTNVCLLLDIIEEEGIDKARIEDIKNLMEVTSKSFKEVCSMLKLSEEDMLRYKEMI